MASNIKITAINKEFQNGTKGYQVLIDGMEGRLACKMNFSDPLKAIRYMFMLSKRLDLQIDNIQLTALSLAYQKAKSSLEKVVDDAQQAINLPEEEEKETEPEPLEVPTEQEAEKIESPILKQFKDLKQKHPDAMLLFRCGDFYETYNEDAEAASSILGITLTKSKNVYMAGFPYHALDEYLPRLIRAGKRVAICDQIETPTEKPEAKRRGRKRKITELTQELPLEEEA